MKKFFYLLMFMQIVMQVAVYAGNVAIPTTSQKGWSFSCVVDRISKDYVEFAAKDLNPTLEIGAGRGITSLEVLKGRKSQGNNEKIFINDLSREQLEEGKKENSELNDKRVIMQPGEFPKDLNYEKESFGSILASRCFHFLTIDQWKKGLKKIYDWLKPGGRFYITTGTYFIKHQKNNIESIQSKLKSGDEWPACFKNGLDAYGVSIIEGPATLVDKAILERELKNAGFEVCKIEYLEEIGRNVPLLYLDGREAVGAIAIKP